MEANKTIRGYYVALSPRGFDNECSIVKVASKAEAKILIAEFEYITNWQGRAWATTAKRAKSEGYIDYTAQTFTEDNVNEMTREALEDYYRKYCL